MLRSRPRDGAMRSAAPWQRTSTRHWLPRSQLFGRLGDAGVRSATAKSQSVWATTDRCVCRVQLRGGWRWSKQPAKIRGWSKTCVTLSISSCCRTRAGRICRTNNPSQVNRSQANQQISNNKKTQHTITVNNYSKKKIQYTEKKNAGLFFLPVSFYHIR